LLFKKKRIFPIQALPGFDIAHHKNSNDLVLIDAQE